MRVREVEDTLTDLQGKVPGLEKAKARLTTENRELTDELERVNNSAPYKAFLVGIIWAQHLFVVFPRI